MSKKFVPRHRKPTVEFVTVVGDEGVDEFEEQCKKLLSNGFTPVGGTSTTAYNGHGVFVQSFSRITDTGSIKEKLSLPTTYFLDRSRAVMERLESIYNTYGR